MPQADSTVPVVFRASITRMGAWSSTQGTIDINLGECCPRKELQTGFYGRGELTMVTGGVQQSRGVDCRDCSEPRAGGPTTSTPRA